MAPISSFFSPFLKVPPSSVEDLWSSVEKFKNVRSLLTRRSSINGGGQGRGEIAVRGVTRRASHNQHSGIIC